jgi:hypothetical protein
MASIQDKVHALIAQQSGDIYLSEADYAELVESISPKFRFKKNDDSENIKFPLINDSRTIRPSIPSKTESAESLTAAMRKAGSFVVRG